MTRNHPQILDARWFSWRNFLVKNRYFCCDLWNSLLVGAFCSVRLDWYIFFCVRKDCNNYTKQMYVNIKTLFARATRLRGFLYKPLGLEVYSSSSPTKVSMCFCHHFHWEQGTKLSMELNVDYFILFYFKHGRWKIPKKEWCQMWSVYTNVRVSHNLFMFMVVLTPAVTGLTLWHAVSTQAHIGVAILIVCVICTCKGK